MLALVVLCAFAGVVWLAYTQGVARGRSETPVLAAAGGPEKVAPQNPGGAAVPYQGFKIYEQPAPPDDQADAAPPTPSQQAAKPEAQQAAAPPPAKPVPAPTVTAPPPAEKTAAATPPAAKPAPVQAAPPPAAKPAPAKASPPPAMKQAATTATATGAPRTLPGVGPGVGPGAASAPPAAAPKAAAAAPAPKPAAASGAYVLQIGAYTSQADADAAWKAYKAKHAALLTGYGPDVQKADLGEKGTWYRLRVAGFADKDVASGVCDRLKADGGACFLGK